jgi:hypothetical protein
MKIPSVSEGSERGWGPASTEKGGFIQRTCSTGSRAERRRECSDADDASSARDACVKIRSVSDGSEWGWGPTSNEKRGHP